MATLLHFIFQRHHIPPDEVMAKPKGVRAFMLKSMKIQLDAENEEREKNEARAAEYRAGRTTRNMV